MKFSPSYLAAALFAALAGTAWAADTAGPALHNLPDMKFATLPGFPTCATASIQQGDPATQPVIILARLTKECKIPWHWHTPNEYVMMVQGQGYLEMREGPKAQTLKAGGFGRLPSKHVHQFQCASKSCLLYVHADTAPFDIHYVDAQGKEISPEEAMKAVGETPAK